MGDNNDVEIKRNLALALSDQKKIELLSSSGTTAQRKRLESKRLIEAAKVAEAAKSSINGGSDAAKNGKH
jgi:hypothetical protein